MKKLQTELVGHLQSLYGSGKNSAELDELRLRGCGSFLRLLVTSAGPWNQPGGTLLLIAAQPLAHGGHGDGEKSRRGLDTALLGAFHQSQTMVVSVLHLTHQIEITDGGSHNAPILSAPRWPALLPAGRDTM
jgi:hypothetical protein